MENIQDLLKVQPENGPGFDAVDVLGRTVEILQRINGADAGSLVEVADELGITSSTRLKVAIRLSEEIEPASRLTRHVEVIAVEAKPKVDDEQKETESEDSPVQDPELVKEVDIPETNAKYRNVGAMVLGPVEGLSSKVIGEAVSAVPQNSELSIETAGVIGELEQANNGNGDIDTGQRVLGMVNWQEAAIISSKLAQVLNQDSDDKVRPKAKRTLGNVKTNNGIDKLSQLVDSCRWKVDVFLDSTTKEFIPVTFSIQKLYNVEAMTGSRGMIANGFSVKVIGNMVSINFDKDITIKDILGIIKMDNDLEEMYRESDGQFDLNRPSSTLSSRTVNSGINGIVHLANGKIAYYPDFIGGSEWAKDKLRDYWPK